MRVSTQLSLNVYFLVCLIPSPLTKNVLTWSTVVARAFNPSPEEAEAGYLWVWGQLSHCSQGSQSYTVRHRLSHRSQGGQSYTVRHRLKKAETQQTAPNAKINKVLFYHIALKIYTLCVCVVWCVPLGVLFLLSMRRLRSDFVGQVGRKRKAKRTFCWDYEGSVSFSGGKELRGRRQANLEDLKKPWRWQLTCGLRVILAQSLETRVVL